MLLTTQGIPWAAGSCRAWVSMEFMNLTRCIQSSTDVSCHYAKLNSSSRFEMPHLRFALAPNLKSLQIFVHLHHLHLKGTFSSIWGPALPGGCHIFLVPQRIPSAHKETAVSRVPNILFAVPLGGFLASLANNPLFSLLSPLGSSSSS